MELTYSELQKRDVINIADGRCLGRIVDLKFRFPEGVIEGIIVPGKKICPFLRLFNSQTLYISEREIVKIGGDVILVDLSCSNNSPKDIKVKCPPMPSKKPPKPCPPPSPFSCGVDECGIGDYNKRESEQISFDDY